MSINADFLDNEQGANAELCHSKATWLSVLTHYPPHAPP